MQRDQAAPTPQLPLEEATPSSSQILAYTSSLADLRKLDRAFEVSPPLTFQRVAEKPSFVIPPETPVKPRAGKKLCTSTLCPPLEREQSKDEANNENDQHESQMSVFCVSMASILSEKGESCATVAEYQDNEAFETVDDNCFDLGHCELYREMFRMANLQPTFSHQLSYRTSANGSPQPQPQGIKVIECTFSPRLFFSTLQVAQPQAGGIKVIECPFSPRVFSEPLEVAYMTFDDGLAMRGRKHCHAGLFYCLKEQQLDFGSR
eukprot:g79901.t1